MEGGFDQWGSTVHIKKKITLFLGKAYYNCFVLGKVWGSVIKETIKWNRDHVSVHSIFILIIINIV